MTFDWTNWVALGFLVAAIAGLVWWLKWDQDRELSRTLRAFDSLTIEEKQAVLKWNARKPR